MKKGIIYRITSPSGRIYVGKSKTSLEERYKKGIKVTQVKLFNSVMKYGWDNHTKEIIEEIEFDLLNEREIYWIKFFNSCDEGLNCTYGGDRISITPEEMKEKISKTLKGRKTRPCSEETKRKISEANKGKSKPPISEEHKERIRQFNLSREYGPSPLRGIERSEETKKRISEANKGKKRSNETKQKISEIQKGKTAWNKGLKTGPSKRIYTSMSEETKNKIRESLRLTRENK